MIHFEKTGVIMKYNAAASVRRSIHDSAIDQRAYQRCVPISIDIIFSYTHTRIHAHVCMRTAIARRHGDISAGLTKETAADLAHAC